MATSAEITERSAQYKRTARIPCRLLVHVLSTRVVADNAMTAVVLGRMCRLITCERNTRASRSRCRKVHAIDVTLHVAGSCVLRYWWYQSVLYSPSSVAHPRWQLNSPHHRGHEAPASHAQPYADCIQSSQQLDMITERRQSNYRALIDMHARSAKFKRAPAYIPRRISASHPELHVTIGCSYEKKNQPCKVVTRLLEAVR
jgi:hypothetical protein